MAEKLPPVVVEIIAKYESLKAGLGEAKAEVGKFESKAAGAFGGVAKAGKIALGGIAIAAVGVGYESVKMASEFQKDTNLLVTAAGESPKALAKIRSGIEDIATATGTSLPMLTEGMYQVEKGGYRGADGLRILRAAAQGAAEEGANLSTVTNAMTTVMKDYGIKADHSVQVMNALKTAAGGTKDTMENFSASLSSVLPVAASAGISFDQVGGAIATMTQSGESAQLASQHLAFTITSLMSAGTKATKTMQQFGISSTDLAQNLSKRGLGGSLDYLVNTIGQHLGPQGLVMIDTFKKAQSAGEDMHTMIRSMPPDLAKMSQGLLDGHLTLKAYTKEAGHLTPQQAIMARQFAMLMRSSTGFSDALKSGMPQAVTMNSVLKTMLGGQVGLGTALKLTGGHMADLKDITARTGASLHDGAKDVEGWASTSNLFSIQVAKAKESLVVMGVKIGSFLIPIIQQSAHFLASHTTTLKVFAGIIGGVVVAAIGVYIGTLTVSTAKSLWSFAKMTVAGAEWAAQQAGYYITVAAEAASSFTTMLIRGAAWAAGMAVQAAEVIIDFFPVIAAVALVGIAAYELYKHWDQVWGFIKDVTKAAWGFIVGVFQTTVGFIRKHMAAIVGAIFLIFPPLGLVIAAVHEVYKHWDTIWSAIKTVTSAVVGFIRMIFDGLVHAGLWVIREEVSLLLSVWNTVWGAIRTVTSAVWNFLQPIFSAIVNGGLHYINVAVSAFGSVWSSIWNTVSSVVQSVWGTIQPIISMISGALDKISGLLGSVKSGAGSLGGIVGKGLSGIGHTLGFANGGVIPGPKGAPMMVLAHGGEQVISNEMQDHPITPILGGRYGGRPIEQYGGGETYSVTVPVHVDGREVARATAKFTRAELLRGGRNLPNIGLT